MIKKGAFGEYVINGIYQHYNNKKYYMIESISYLHDSTNIYLINYHQCDINGFYISIRSGEGDKEVIVHQPFATHETRWHENVKNTQGQIVERFTFIK